MGYPKRELKLMWEIMNKFWRVDFPFPKITVKIEDTHTLVQIGRKGKKRRLRGYSSKKDMGFPTGTSEFSNFKVVQHFKGTRDSKGKVHFGNITLENGDAIPIEMYDNFEIFYDPYQRKYGSKEDKIMRAMINIHSIFCPSNSFWISPPDRDDSREITLVKNYLKSMVMWKCLENRHIVSYRFYWEKDWVQYFRNMIKNPKTWRGEGLGMSIGYIKALLNI